MHETAGLSHPGWKAAGATDGRWPQSSCPWPLSGTDSQAYAHGEVFYLFPLLPAHAGSDSAAPPYFCIIPKPLNKGFTTHFT